MGSQEIRNPVRADWLLVLFLLGASGCCYLHPIHAPEAQFLEPCRSLPQGCKDHVHVFIINGLDPMDYSNLTGLRDYVQSLGFRQTYFGQIYHYWWFKKEIRRIHQEDPEARFVFVGFSVGVNLADCLARALEPEGVYVELLVFLSGNHPIQPMPHEPPPNVGKVVNILASGLMQTRGERDWAENLRPLESWHFDIPTHHDTLAAMTDALIQVAATVPALMPAPPALPSDFEDPTPRPVTPRKTAKVDEWDFLKPVSRIKTPPSR